MGCRKRCRKRCRCPCDEEEVDPCAPAAPPPPPPPPAARPPLPAPAPAAPAPPPPPPPAPAPPAPAPPPPPPANIPRPPAEPLPEISTEKDKVIATLFRALAFSPVMLGGKLDGALGTDAKRILSNKYFKNFHKNFSQWATAHNKNYAGIEPYLKAVETIPPLAGSKPALSKYILNAYLSSKLGAHSEKDFARLFFDLIIAFYHLFKDELCKDKSDQECMSFIYNQNFRDFMQGNVLKVFKPIAGSNIHESIVTKLLNYDKIDLDRKLLAKNFYGGKRRTRKMKKAKKHTRRK